MSNHYVSVKCTTNNEASGFSLVLRGLPYLLLYASLHYTFGICHENMGQLGGRRNGTQG